MKNKNVPDNVRKFAAHLWLSNIGPGDMTRVPTEHLFKLADQIGIKPPELEDILEFLMQRADAELRAIDQHIATRPDPET